MAKIERMVIVSDPEHEEYSVFCKGCDTYHMIPVKWSAQQKLAREANFRAINKMVTPTLEWKFNGNFDSPTFFPSVIQDSVRGGKKHRCHFVISDGKMTYMGDCTHTFKNKVVTIPDINGR